MELADNDPLYRSATGIALASVLLMQVGNVLGRRHRHAQRSRSRPAAATACCCSASPSRSSSPGHCSTGRRCNGLLGTGPVAPEIFLLAWLGIPLLFGLDLARKRLSAKLAW